VSARTRIDLIMGRGYPQSVKRLAAAILVIVSAHVSADAVRLSPGGPLSVQAAIDAAKNGDTILLSAGTYTSPVAISVSGRKSLTLRGEGGVLLLCTDLYENVMTLGEGTDLRIEGIAARHSQPLGSYACEGSVISAQSIRGLVISNCELAGSGSIGVDLSSCEDVEVSDCLIHDNTFAAFSLTDVTSITISGNRIERNAATMYSAGVSGLTMVGNTVSDNGSRR